MKTKFLKACSALALMAVSVPALAAGACCVAGICCGMGLPCCP
jgi:hypothetical protein